MCTYKLPYYVDSTGGLLDTSKRVQIENAYEVEGSFNMAYVNEIHATIPIALISFFNSNWDMVKEEELTYGNMTVEEVNEYGKIMMREGAKNAIEVAYNKANIDIDINNKEIVVIYRYEESDTNLKVGDIINKVNDMEVSSFEELSNYLSQLKVGDKITLEVTNNDKKYNRYANIVEIEGEPKIGILLQETRDIKTDPECNLSYTSNETGSSGGLMTALTIYNYLVEEDITGGKVIAGTGTIERDGTVGEIAGIKYKLAGVVKNKADIFLVPAGDNYEEAMKLKEKNNYDIEIVAIATFDEAVTYLEEMIK